MGGVCLQATRDWEDVLRRHQRAVAVLFTTACIAAAVGGWIAVIQEHNIFFEICAAFVTCFALFVFLNVVRTRIRHRNLELLRAAHPLPEQHDPSAATETEIEALPRIVYRRTGDIEQSESAYPREGSHATSCSICLAGFLDEEVLISLPCHHLFHQNCIRPWLVRKALCPLCKASTRTPLTPASAPSNPILAAGSAALPSPNRSRTSDLLPRSSLL